MDPNTEIRKLKPAELYTLASILASSDSWKTLLAVVPKEGTENVLKFNTEHITLIERASCQQRKSGAEIFLEEWSTMGKQRPTLSSTLDLLVRAQLFRAADYVAVDLLKQQPPGRPTSGPAAPIDISDEELANLRNRGSSEFGMSDSNVFGSKESLDSVLNDIAYPSQLSAENLAEHREEPAENQTRLIGLDRVDQVLNLRISPVKRGDNNSNLMQFSKSDVDNPGNNSNLIKFSTGSIRSPKTTDLPQDSSLATGVCNTHAQQMIKNENILAQGSGANTSSTSLSGNDSLSVSDNCSRLELQTNELPAFVADIGRGSTSVYNNRNELRSSELPQFVAEIAHRKSNLSFGEPILLNGSTSSETSSIYLTEVTSSSRNTESNIPICVNFNSESSENKELVSAELPQFVADLGHRQSQDNYSETIDGGSELVDESSNGEYAGRFFGSSSASSSPYLILNSQELPLVVSECNKKQLKENLGQ